LKDFFFEASLHFRYLAFFTLNYFASASAEYSADFLFAAALPDNISAFAAEKVISIFAVISGRFHIAWLLSYARPLQL